MFSYLFQISIPGPVIATNFVWICYLTELLKKNTSAHFYRNTSSLLMVGLHEFDA